MTNEVWHNRAGLLGLERSERPLFPHLKNPISTLIFKNFFFHLFNLYIFHLGFFAFGSKWAESALKSDFFEKT